MITRHRAAALCLPPAEKDIPCTDGYRYPDLVLARRRPDDGGALSISPLLEVAEHRDAGHYYSIIN